MFKLIEGGFYPDRLDKSVCSLSRPRHVVSGQLGPARWACGQSRVKDVRSPRCSQCEHVGRSVWPVKWKCLC